ncbi:MAG: hypothetical protein MJZ32_01425 [Bacteroidaceae bacterium]|nr:hypothetical protein [Bacteroidaceae bacterium]
MKKIIYSIFALIASFAMPSVAMAEETIDVQYLVIQQDDGTESRFALKEYPEITFNGDALVIESAERNLEIAIVDVLSYSFETVQESLPTAVEAVRQDAPAISFAGAEFRGLASGAAVTAWSLNGQMLTTIKATADGIAKIDLSALPKGVIILRTPGKTIKIINK